MPLKYLFRCVFKDKTVIDQDQADISSIDPKRSMFYDVVQRLEDVEVFGIYGPMDGTVPPDKNLNTYVVDLTDGTFLVNGVPFRMHEEEEYEGPLKLVFFRRHKVHSRPVLVNGLEVTREVVYRIGWQAMGKYSIKLKSGNTIVRRRLIERVMEID